MSTHRIHELILYIYTVIGIKWWDKHKNYYCSNNSSIFLKFMVWPMKLTAEPTMCSQSKGPPNSPALPTTNTVTPSSVIAPIWYGLIWSFQNRGISKPFETGPNNQFNSLIEVSAFWATFQQKSPQMLWRMWDRKLSVAECANASLLYQPSLVFKAERSN